MFFKKSNDEKQDILEKFTGERLSLEHAEYIKSLVERVSEIDKGRIIFGANRHQYKLNPVVSMNEIYNYERRHSITLPEEYVFFLTKVGNGGAGPYYGLYKLEDMSKYNMCQDSMDKEAFINRHLTKEKWNLMMGKLDEADDTEYDEIMEQLCAGSTILGTQGCTYDNLLMLNGSEKGNMIYIDWNLESDYPPYFTGMSFLEWYENFFKEIILGNSVQSYGYIRLGKEEELINDYQNANLENKRSILQSFVRFSSIKIDTLEFLKQRDNKALDSLRTQLLLRFDKKAAIEMFDALIREENFEAVIACARKIPDDIKDNYYDTMLKLLYNQALKEKKKIIFFLTDCKSFLGKDLIPFAKDTAIDDKNRKTAIWAIGKTVDKMDYLDEFISWMKCDSYQIALAALQAVAKEKNPNLLETYKWMWDKYHKDSTMCSNLKVAFNTHGMDA